MKYSDYAGKLAVKAVLWLGKYWCCVNDHAGMKWTLVHMMNNNPSKFKHVHKALCVPYFTATVETDVIQYSVTFLNNVNCSVTKAKCLSDMYNIV